MRTLTGNIAANYFDYGVWLQERQQIDATLTIGSGETWQSTFLALLSASGTVVARYALDSNGKCLVDVTDYIRATNSGVYVNSSFRVARYNGNAGTYTDETELSYMVYGLINPARLLAPPTPEIAALNGSEGAFVYPSKIIRGEKAITLHAYGFGGAGNTTYYFTSDQKAVGVWFPGVEMMVVVAYTSSILTVSDAKDLMAAFYQEEGQANYEIKSNIDIVIDSNGTGIVFCYMACTDATTAQHVKADLDNFLAGSAFSWETNADWVDGVETRNIWVYGGTSINASAYAVAIDCAATIRSVALYSATGKLTAKRTFQEQECGKEYARVSWRPAYGYAYGGPLKVAYWELRDHTVKTTPTELQVNKYGDAYRDVRTREDSVTLTLSGLTQFDVWYYSDIVSSSEVSIDGFGAVKVTSKEIAIPDGDCGAYLLKIKVTLAEYDAVSM